MITKNKNKASGLIWIEKLSVLLDSKYTIPGTRFKFGLDPIFGLLPVFGDLTSFTISCAILIYMAKNGASGKLLIMMTGNIIIDTVLGSIPLLGNIFDFTYKANSRNLKLLKQHYEEGKYSGSGKNIILLLTFGLILIIFLILITLFLFTKFLYQLIFNGL